MSDDDRLSESDLKTITMGQCPDCESRGFVLGPMGGAALNIECANTNCRARFNVTTFGGEVLMAEPIPRENEGGARWPSAPHKGTFS
jgi:hypothetical protein